MRIDTALNKRNAAVSRVRDLYSRARSCKMTSAAINTEYLEILNALGGAPGWVRAYVRGYHDCIYNQLWDEMEFCYLVDGKWYSTARDTDKPRWDTLDNYDMSGKPCAHFWRNTEKPYTEISPAGR